MFSEQYVYTLSEDDPALDEKIRACAYQFGLNIGAVRDVLRVVLREELLRLTGKATD